MENLEATYCDNKKSDSHLPKPLNDQREVIQKGGASCIRWLTEAHLRIPRLYTLYRSVCKVKVDMAYERCHDCIHTQMISTCFMGHNGAYLVPPKFVYSMFPAPHSRGGSSRNGTLCTTIRVRRPAVVSFYPGEFSGFKNIGSATRA
jgi:hypothetical protein